MGFVDFSNLSGTNADVLAVNKQANVANYSKGVIVPSTYANDPASFWKKNAYGGDDNATVNRYGVSGATLTAYIYSNSKAEIGTLATENSATKVVVEGAAADGVKDVNTLNQINSLPATVTSVTITGKVSNSQGAVSISNQNITSLSFKELDAAGKTINLTLANLVTLDLTDANVVTVDLTDTNSEVVISASEGFDVSVITPEEYRDNVTIAVASKELTVAGNSLATNLPQAAAEGNTKPSSVEILHVTGTLTKADLAYIQGNLSSLKLLDLSGCTYDSDVTANDVAAILPYQYQTDGIDAIIVPTPSNDNILTNGVDMYVYQQRGSAVGYYTGDILNVYSTNSRLLGMTSVVNESTSLMFIPGYKADGTPNIDNSSGNFSGYVPVASGFVSDVLSQIPAPSIDFTWVNHSKLLYDFSDLNPNTHYIVLPQSTSGYDAASDMVETIESSDYEYNDNIWVVSTYKSPTQPYAQGTCYDGKYRDFSATGLNRTANITYIRTAGKLGGAEPYLPLVYLTADQMTILGNLNEDDLDAIKEMRNPYVDLSLATLIGDVDITDYDNAYVKTLVLPNNSTKEDVDDVFNTLNAHGVLDIVGCYVETAIEATATTQAVPEKTLIAYSATQGSVDQMQYLVKSETGSRAVNVENIIMSGNLNAYDICVGNAAASGVGVELADDGHLYATGCTPEGATAISNSIVGPLAGASLKLVDFTNAIFDQPTEAELTANERHCPQYFTAEEKKALVTDMNFVALGCMPTDSLRLPVDQSQKVINAYSLSQLNGGSIQSLCIPSNFQYIMDGAFNRFDGTNLSHIYTDNTYGEANLVNDVVDNGIGWCDVTVNGETSRVLKGSYTIASTVKYIARAAFDTNTTNGVADVYVLAKIAPVCEPYAFNSTKLIGNNGFKNYNPICRDNYYNGGWIAVLRFPNALDDDAKKLYTDIEREYFYVDETGAVDGDGNLMTWPNHSEFSRSWNQANLGYTWSDWDTTRNMPPYNENAGGVYGQMLVYGAWDGNFVTLPKKQDVPADATSYSTQATLDATDQHADCNNCDFASHIGWHQFLLAQPGYFYEKKSEAYKQTPWYTFCIPFDMTYDELNKFLGSPEDSETGFKMPEVRTLRHVIRYPEATTVDGKKKKENLVSIIISKDLVANESDVKTYGQTNTKREAELVSITRKKGDADVYVKGGYPYIVRGWIPEAETMPENLAKYVLAKGMDYFTAYDLGNVAYVSGGDTISTGLYDRTKESGFVAMPYFNHTVDAYDWKNQNFYGDRDKANIKYKGKDGNTYDLDYKYNFCGRYESGKVFNPQYSYYMNSSGAFKRCTTPEDSRWDIYNCIITHHGEGMPLSILISEAYNWRSTYIKELNDHVWAGQYGEYDESEIGESESPESGSGETNFIVLFDEDIEGEMTDGIVNTEFIKSLAGDSKVYNINGQFVGTSINGLAKGVYVVNGRKFVVK